jgi:hypothetical protein
MNTTSNGEVYGSRTLYTAIVAGAAFLLIATVSSFGTSTSAPTERHLAKTPTTVETIVVTPGQST